MSAYCTSLNNGNETNLTAAGGLAIRQTLPASGGRCLYHSVAPQHQRRPTPGKLRYGTQCRRGRRGQRFRACCPNAFCCCSRAAAKRGPLIFRTNSALHRSAATPKRAKTRLGNTPFTIYILTPAFCLSPGLPRSTPGGTVGNDMRAALVIEGGISWDRTS
jgi:hypothetical protein